MISLLLTIAFSIGSCRSPAPAAESPQPGPLAEKAVAAPTGTRLVSKVLFLDLTDPCKCTKARQEKTWTELQQAVEGTDIEVERVHWDSYGERAEAFAEKKPFSVIPALYFLDDEDGIVDMVQGEVSRTQIEKILGGAGSGQCSPGQDCPGD
jgi:hypothetical protein